MKVDLTKVIAKLSKTIGDQQVTIALLQVQIDEPRANKEVVRDEPADLDHERDHAPD